MTIGRIIHHVLYWAFLVLGAWPLLSLLEAI